MKSYQEENNQIVTDFIRKRFLKAYLGDPDEEVRKKYATYNSIELIIDKKCNLACKYCYYNKFGDQYYNEESLKKENIIKNAKEVNKWLLDNKIRTTLQLFSGEILNRKIGLELIDIFSEYATKEGSGHITIPTNATFLTNEKKIKEIKEAIKGKRIYISLSMEGKYCEISRPYKGNVKEIRDDEYYDRAFKFASEVNNKVGFHPMIHSSNIYQWKKNIDWYIDKHKEHNLSLDSFYLLEVRNSDWNKDEIKEFGSFIEYLCETTFKKVCDSNPEKFIRFIIDKKGFNILATLFSCIGRGIGCSIQSTLMVRLGDMTIVPCHRLAYKWFEIGKLKLPEFEAYDVKKPELLISINSCLTKNFPKCDTCTLFNELCSSGCLGSQFENSYDLFYPNEVVCALEHVKIISIIKGLKKVGVFYSMLPIIDNCKRSKLLEIDKLFCN